MGNEKGVKFQENSFSGNEIKSIFCPPLFRKRPISEAPKTTNELSQMIRMDNFTCQKISCVLLMLTLS